MEPWFEGKVALVTGAGDGIGRASALLFARRGAKVVVSDIDEDGGHETVSIIRAEGLEASFVKGDVTNKGDVGSFIDFTLQHYGRIDCAHNNAGISHPLDSNWDDDAFQKTIDINLLGVNNCLKSEISHMLKAGGGSIVNTASISGYMASAEIPLPAYTASKHAVIGLTKAIALQYARSGIRVNALCPGVTITKMIRDVMSRSPEARGALDALSPMGRMAVPMEMAEAAIWLCSDKASYVTGQSLIVDGGVLATSGR